MKAKPIMIQGTGSSVGKSLLATAFCRILRQDGYDVAPFKAQNMSLNSAVTPDGGEIGRAQAVQAEAAGVLPTTAMNPILLKPESDHRSQLVVLGRAVGHIESRHFNRRKDDLWQVVVQSLEDLLGDFEVALHTGAPVLLVGDIDDLWQVVVQSLEDLLGDFEAVVIEGAGSPAEINLRQGDIVNMEVALHTGAPVLLVGDIDKGGVFASIYGTLELLPAEERELVKGVIINKFRGDMSILEPGLRRLEELTGVPVLGVVPYLKDVYVPEEDSPAEGNTTGSVPFTALIDVAVIALPHIANFDDFDPIRREEYVGLRYVRSLDQLGTPDLVILPGTKTTADDLDHLRKIGLAERLVELANHGTGVIGICGGYQMLGQKLLDPDRVDSSRESMDGLGLLPAVTRFSGRKTTHRVIARVQSGHGLLQDAARTPFEGYEIHTGVTTTATDAESPFLVTSRSGETASVEDGCQNRSGWVLGTYIHGLFHEAALRRSLLRSVAARKGVDVPFGEDDFSQSSEYDRLAEHVRASLDMGTIYRMAGLRPR